MYLRYLLLFITLSIALSAVAQAPSKQVQNGNEQARSLGRHRPLISGLQPDSPWPKYQGDSQNTGLGKGGGSNGVLKWTYATGGYIANSSPAIATVPPTVTFAASAVSATFAVSTTAVGTATSATIIARFGGSSASSKLTVQRADLSSLSTQSQIVGGNTPPIRNRNPQWPCSCQQ